jgi:hypothetical protein
MSGKGRLVRMIAIPVPGWVALIVAGLGIIFWIYELTVVKPKQRRERLARKRRF